MGGTLLGQAQQELADVGLPEDSFARELIAEVEDQAREALGSDAFGAAFSGA